MKALEFTEALREIVEGLRVELIVNTIQGWMNHQFAANQPPPLQEPVKDAFSDVLMMSRSGYDRLSALPDTGKILEGLGISDFFDAQRIRRLIVNVSSVGNIPQVQGIPDLHAYLEKFKSLQRLAATCTTLLESEKIGAVPPDEGIFQLQLMKYADEDGISVERVAALTKLITELHTSMAIVLEVESELRFKYFDSGSDVLFGMQCTKAVADAISNVLLQWLDKLRFWRYDSHDRKLDSVSKSIDIFNKIHDSVEKGALTENDGAIMKERIFKALDGLTEIGATAPLATNATVNQRQLLTELRNTKLLGAGEEEKANPVATESSHPSS